ETMFGSPYGLPPPPPFCVCTVSDGLAGETLPAASRALTVMTWSLSADSPPQSPVVTVPSTEPHWLSSANRSYATTPVAAVEAAHDTVTLFDVMLTGLGLPGAVGGLPSPPPLVP